ncbi:beta-1,3-galactosyltransferase 4 [Pezoporus occidentalis]|uniref:beta-1,3-galactosyltransferase 4 n=1 Tax=Pezoporus occidentalis TaxID=407982 RepID=UPI002F917B75
MGMGAGLGTGNGDGALALDAGVPVGPNGADPLPLGNVSTYPASIPILLSPEPCGPSGPFLLVLVPSAAEHAEQRQAVRDTWGRGTPPKPPKTLQNAPQMPETPRNAPETPENAPETPKNAPKTPRNAPETPENAPETPQNAPEEPETAPETPSMRTIFVVGLPGSRAAWRALREEWLRHGDVLQGAFPDAYGTLTLKTLLLLRWASRRCPGARFLLKADDDVFVNVPALARHLRAPTLPRRLYLGRVHWWVPPNRDPSSRHHVPAALYPASRFPPYCSGTAYVLSRAAALAVLAAAPHVPFVGPEDVWVGLCARRAGLAPRHTARLAGAMRVPLDGCCYGEVMFSAHRLRPDDMREVWGVLTGGGNGCGALERALGVLRCRVMAARAGGGW